MTSKRKKPFKTAENHVKKTENQVKTTRNYVKTIENRTRKPKTVSELPNTVSKRPKIVITAKNNVKTEKNYVITGQNCHNGKNYVITGQKLCQNDDNCHNCRKGYKNYCKRYLTTVDVTLFDTFFSIITFLPLKSLFHHYISLYLGLSIRFSYNVFTL